MTLYELAKRANIKQPQHLYNMYRMGYIKAERKECPSCGHTALVVSDEEANRYLRERAERQAKKAAKIASESAVIEAIESEEGEFAEVSSTDSE
jgi:ribosomal protein S27AE